MSDNPRLLVNADGSAKPRICGFETEYGYDVLGIERIDRREALRTGTVHEAFGGMEISGTYNVEGAREYVDHTHPEYSTPECNSFLTAVKALLRGHVITSERYSLAHEQLREKIFHPPDTTVHLSANTTDFKGNTWGSHENMIALRALEEDEYIPALAALRCSRIVWSGAGYVERQPGWGFRFVLSEKAQFIHEVANNNSTFSRPLVNLRDEALADEGRYRRIHDVSGESIFSPRANVLRLATGSLVLRACELGVSFDDLIPEDPVGAMWCISDDDTLQQKIKLSNGKEVTGVEHQLLLAERLRDPLEKAEYMTPEEARALSQWVDLNQALKEDPDACGHEVDHVAKRHVIDRELSKGLEPGRTPYEVALGQSLGWHQLLPEEGRGMALLRKGFFTDSPSSEGLDDGFALSANRAFLRANAIWRLRQIKVKHFARWDTININMQHRGSYDWEAIPLLDPYADQDTRLEEALLEVEAAAEAA